MAKGLWYNTPMMRCRSLFSGTDQHGKTQKGVSLIELVLALGLIFISAGGVMSVIVAGVSQPKRNQFTHIRDSLAKAKLDELMNTVVTPTPTSGVFTENPDYDYNVVTTPADFDSSVTVITVSVTGPRPQQMTSVIHGVFCPPNGAIQFGQYGCNGCHTIGTGAPGIGPNLNNAQLTANQVAAGNTTLDDYIQNSIRDPDDFIVTGYTPDMAAYSWTSTMPPEDARAISQYLQTIP